MTVRMKINSNIQRDKIAEYIELKKEQLTNFYDLWNDLDYFDNLINIIILLKEKINFQEYLERLKSFFEKLTFRIGPRKDYQFLPFTHFFIEYSRKAR